MALGGPTQDGDVPDDLSVLSEEDVQRLLQIIEGLEHSAFDYLQLVVGGMHVVLGKGDPPDHVGAPTSGQPLGVPSGHPAPLPLPVRHVPEGTAADRADCAPDESPARSVPGALASDATEGTVEIRAPMMGIFYAQPQPGAPPYVEVGMEIDEDTTVGLVEVMKMFNAIPAGVAGTVVEVLGESNQLVEYGQPLFRVRRR
jgi:acetyl-CoA carboxylase biotin carboxyl carrier protein